MCAMTAALSNKFFVMEKLSRRSKKEKLVQPEIAVLRGLGVQVTARLDQPRPTLLYIIQYCGLMKVQLGHFKGSPKPFV